MAKNLYFLKQDGVRQYYIITASGKRRHGILSKCSHCKKPFVLIEYMRKPEQQNFFCSKSCSHKFQMDRHGLTCFVCNAAICRTLRQISKSKTSKFFCSKACQTQANRNPESGYSSNKRKHEREKHCLFCGSDLIYSKGSIAGNGLKYCNRHCAFEHKKKLNLESWLAGKHKGYSGKSISLSSIIRNYLFEKHNYSCQRCGFKETNPFTNLPVLEVHHIDGDPRNCHESNLEVLCKNCHAMTENYGSRNKNSPRTHR